MHFQVVCKAKSPDIFVSKGMNIKDMTIEHYIL